MTVYQRFRRWSEAGIWEAVATTLAQAMADKSRHSLDSTTVRGHVSAAGAKGGLANKLLAGLLRGGQDQAAVPTVDQRRNHGGMLLAPGAKRSERPCEARSERGD